MDSKKARIVGWVLSALLAALLIGPSGLGKFVEWEGKEEAFAKMGFTTDLMFKIGILEVAIALLFLVPRTAFLSAILITAYLGGATVTHLRVGEPFFMPIIVGVVVWIALGLRRPGIFAMAFKG
ncbi:MAG: DoxX family protein [Pirellulales bacterium]